MQAYKFNTLISENGTISLPNEPQLFNTEVEIIVVPKIKAVKEEKGYTANDFIREFSGCLKNLPKEDPSDLCYEYLRKKYQIHSDTAFSREEIDEARYKYLMEKHK
jgi:hypothetical protein